MVDYPEVDLGGEQLSWPAGVRREYLSIYFPRTLVVLNPAVTTNPMPMGSAHLPTEIYRIDSYVEGTTPSITFKVFIGSDISGTGLEVIVDGTTVTTSTIDKQEVIDNAIMAADDLMWAHITAKSGTVNSLCIIPRCRLRS